MKRSSVVEEWRAEGRVEGRVEGRAEGQQSMLVDVLREYFGQLPDDLTAKVHQTTDAATLRRWLLLASKATDLAAFRTQAGI